MKSMAPAFNSLITHPTKVSYLVFVWKSNLIDEILLHSSSILWFIFFNLCFRHIHSKHHLDNCSTSNAFILVLFGFLDKVSFYLHLSELNEDFIQFQRQLVIRKLFVLWIFLKNRKKVDITMRIYLVMP